MAANTSEKATTMAFRAPLSKRRALEAIQIERGHAQLSDTLREAIDQYIHWHFAEQDAPPGDE